MPFLRVPCTMKPSAPLDHILTKTSSGASPTLVDSVYFQLRRNIITGIHAPGEKLRVEHLKDLYNLGAGTLREVLLLLISDGLVTSKSQRGFWVTPISIAAFEDISNTRLFIEEEALKQSIMHGDNLWESQLVAAYHNLTEAESQLNVDQKDTFNNWEQYNCAFHEALIAACPSHWLLHFQHILYHQSERYRHLSLSYLATTPQRNIHQEHQTLFKAALNHDATLATTTIKSHIMRTLENIKQRLPELLNTSA